MTWETPEPACLGCGETVPRGQQWEVHVAPDRVSRWPFCGPCYRRATASGPTI